MSDVSVSVSQTVKDIQVSVTLNGESQVIQTSQVQKSVAITVDNTRTNSLPASAITVASDNFLEDADAQSALATLAKNVRGAILIDMGAADRTLTLDEAKKGVLIPYNVGDGTKTITVPSISDNFAPSNIILYNVAAANTYYIKSETGGAATLISAPLFDVLGYVAGSAPASLYNSTVQDSSFGASWNGSKYAPTKNSVYDAIVTAAGAYKNIFENCGVHTAAMGAATYTYGYNRATVASGVTSGGTISVIGIYSADHATVSGLTAKLRIRASLNTNATAPTGSYRFALFPVSPTGGVAANVVYTVGTEVSGSTTGTSTTPTANTAVALVGSDFVLPADGQYAICLVTTGTVAANAHIGINAQLQIRYVP